MSKSNIAYAEPLELPKEIAFAYGKISKGWTRELPISIICHLHNDSQYEFEDLVLKTRNIASIKEHKYINIRSKTYALEAPLLFIIMFTRHPEIEILSIKEAT